MNRKNSRKPKRFLLAAFLLPVFFLLSCNEAPPVELPQTDLSEITVATTYSDTAILVSANHDEHLLTFQNLETGLRYTLTYDGVTDFADKYGTAMSAEQIATASIADITFVKEKKQLLSFHVSEEYFTVTDVSFESLAKNDTRMNLMGEEYKLDDYLVIASENETMERMELYEGDVVTVFGKDHTIYSMHLESGHGYLRLENDTYFIDGWIEVGNKVITRVTENMLLTVPEGQYDVLVSNEGISGNKQVTIGRNQEVSLDLGDIEHEVKYGNVLFVLNPSKATLFVDGVKVDASAPVSLEYGIHQLICRADGYEILSNYIKVGDDYASVSITLTPQTDEKDEEPEKEDKEQTENPTTEPSVEIPQIPLPEGADTENPTELAPETDVPQSDTSGITTNETGMVYIDAPEDVEVYVDGEYIGVAPVVFPKKGDTMLITLRKAGYQTRSYTLRLDNSGADVHYSFSGLLPSQGETEPAPAQ